MSLIYTIHPRNIYKKLKNEILYLKLKLFPNRYKINKINLCGGTVKIPGYFNVDIKGSDLNIDLEKRNLPFIANSIDYLVCISAINYFCKKRAQDIIKEVYRIMHSGGIVRFGVQDLKLIVSKYLNNDKDFFYQKKKDGSMRFEGKTPCEMINSWFFGGYMAGGKYSKFFYDYETLALMFEKAGFKNIREMKYRESDIPNIELIDNREDQMFFLEATK